jgi:hypothetical protein
MKAIHGGKAKHDRIDSPKIAALLRGGMRPKADVDPAARRGTRDLVRRCTHLLRKRSALLSHVQHTHSQDTLPDIGQNLAYQAHRAGVAERFHDPAGHKTLEVDLALITYDDALLRDLERSMLKPAKPHDAPTLDLLQTGPGMGTILRLVRLDDIHDSGRLPSVQACASYARVVQCRTEAAGKRLGTSGTKLGNAHLT